MPLCHHPSQLPRKSQPASPPATGGGTLRVTGDRWRDSAGHRRPVEGLCGSPATGGGTLRVTGDRWRDSAGHRVTGSPATGDLSVASTHAAMAGLGRTVIARAADGDVTGCARPAKTRTAAANRRAVADRRILRSDRPAV